MDRTKLSLSHALSQSVKISLFEELIMGTIEQTKDIPKSLSETGKIGVRLFPRLPPILRRYHILELFTDMVFPSFFVFFHVMIV